MVIFYKSKIYDSENQEVTFPRGKLKLINHFQGKILASL